MSVNVAQFIINQLESRGLKHIFLLPGGGCMYLVDAVAKSDSIKGIPLLHEQSVGIAAEAYSQFTNNLSAALVTTGPGATNIITACAAAWLESSPVLFISGQVKSSDSAEKFGNRQYGFQEIPITEMVKPITKKSVKLRNANEISATLNDLFAVALDGRPGPVWLDIPLDLQNSEVETVGPTTLSRNYAPPSLREDDIQVIISNWINAERPLLLIGNGVRLSNCISEVRRLIKLSKTPTLLTWKMLDLLDENDRFNAGRPGSIAQRWSNFAQQSCDFLLTIGARLDVGQTAYNLNNFAIKANRYVCDVDETELLKFSNNFKTVNCNAKILVNALINEFEINNIDIKFESWMLKIHNWKNSYPITLPKHLEVEDGINIYYLIDKLSSLLGKDAIVVPGSSGACSEITMQAFKVKLGQRIFNSEGLGPMGFGLPAAIGTSFAAPNRRIISIDGDGGFLMNIQELASVELYKLPIIFFVLNNNGYGSIKTTQDNYFDGRRIGTDRSSGLGLPNLEKIAYGFDIKYARIENNSELSESLPRILEHAGPLIVEIKVDKNQITEPRVATSIDSDGSFTSAPMEIMSPSLPIKILNAELN